MVSHNSRQAEPFRRLVGSESWVLLEKLGELLAERGIEAYIVGGWVRDTLLGRETADIDIAVAGDALEIASGVAESLDGRYVPLDVDNKVARVVLPDKRQLDFSAFEGTIERDLARRDFTVNAMAVSLRQFGRESPQVIDPFKGQADVKKKIIRTVSDNVFSEDAVRLLRAARLAAELGFIIDKPAEALIRQHSHLISSVAGERVREEFLRLLAISGAGQLKHLDELGLLIAIFPELADAKGVGQPKEHHWDVFEHSLRTVAAVDLVLQQGDWEFADKKSLAGVPWSDVLAGRFVQEVSSGSTRRTLLKLAALLHDINKPQTKALDENGRMRFLGHAQEGAETAVKMLQRLRFSAKEIKLVETEVLHHLRPTQLSQSDLPTRRAIYRYFRDTGEAGIDILFLSLADHLATRGPGLIPDGWQEHLRLVEYVIGKHSEQEKLVNPPKLLDGYDIINIFRIPVGPQVGELLEAVREARASGELTTREEALSYISDRLKEKHA
ncbi:MAG TPA: HD domain-containing protein [Dehalococcoidales bacterium]|nr:HD domain-containing protein [Dehalococcoidales bacterium]